MRDKAKACESFVFKKIMYLHNNAELSFTKAILANLRRGVGKSPASTPELWELTLDGLPEELYSKSGEPSNCEWVVHTVLTLFAVHQQGKDLKSQFMHKQNVSLGTALRQLVVGEEEQRIKRRFDAIVTSNNLEEMSQHLRGIVQMMRAKNIGFDYVRLARDLFWFSFEDARDSVRLIWGQDYYRNIGEENKEE